MSSRIPMRASSRSIVSASAACAIRSVSRIATALRRRRSPPSGRMSRCPPTAKARTCRGWSPRSTRCASRCRCARLPALLDALLVRLEAEAGHIDIEFPWFVRKSAPVSGGAEHDGLRGDACAPTRPDNARTVTVTVVVPVMSLCPSSKAIADYGAHNQRSHLTLSVRPLPGAQVSLAELVSLAEEEASCELYGLLKRNDEKFVTERAYERPRFVEDLVRGIAARLVDDARYRRLQRRRREFRVDPQPFGLRRDRSNLRSRSTASSMRARIFDHAAARRSNASRRESSRNRVRCETSA